MIWISDIHLNFLTQQQRIEYYQTLKQANSDDILITGDIGESHNIETFLKEMKEHTEKNIYFVAGNHDYYGSSIKEVRAQLRKNKDAYYLPKSSGVKLDKHTILIGQDGWGDGRNGDYKNSRLIMADWLYIEELNKAYLKGRTELLKALQCIADGDAERLCKVVLRALKDKDIKHIIIASHVPPFEEACLYAGRKSTPDGLPFFSSKIFGMMLLPIVEKYPEIDFLWLSGHTHSRYNIKKRNNFIVKVAKSEYYFPGIEESLKVQNGIFQ